MNAIRRVRTRVLKVSQKALGEAAGVAQATVSRWEKGELSPSLHEVVRICERHPEITPADFFSDQSVANGGAG